MSEFVCRCVYVWMFLVTYYTHTLTNSFDFPFEQDIVSLYSHALTHIWFLRTNTLLPSMPYVYILIQRTIQFSSSESWRKITCKETLSCIHTQAHLLQQSSWLRQYHHNTYTYIHTHTYTRPQSNLHIFALYFQFKNSTRTTEYKKKRATASAAFRIRYDLRQRTISSLASKQANKVNSRCDAV